MPSWPWRPFTWVILAMQLPFAIWLFAALDRSRPDTTCPKDQVEEFCQAGKALGMTVVVVLILVIWASTDVILGVSWVVTNDNLRTCPACGRRSKNGWLVCPDCGYEFVAAAALMKSPTKNCPECAESIRADAKVCRYCGHHFPTKNVRCMKCNHVQPVLASQTQFTCEQCGQHLKRKTD
ncbi:zinc ribbon domain-containing protein [Mycobacterium sp.]|uniref:zinc ribbon domain-containing protein n=1 Tax=Mycobacterium sp. TaxID=1785 RepID=UPI003F995F82